MKLEDLREETIYEKGTEITTKRFGVCRVKWIHKWGVSIIMGDKKIGVLADAQIGFDEIIGFEK